MSNPLLNEPAEEVRERFSELPPDAQSSLKDFCGWLYEYSRDRADRAWEQSKGPMAVYWKAVAAWSYHIRRLLPVKDAP